MINGSEQVSASKPSDGIEKTEAANSSDIRMVNTELPNVQKKTGEKVPTENYTETQNTQSSVAEITKNTTGSVDAHGHGTATSIKTKAVTAQQSVNAAESAASAQISEAGTKVAADSGSSEVQQSANLYSRYEAFIDRMIGKITDSTIFKLIIRPALKAIGIDEKIFCEFLKQIFLLAGIAVIVAAASLAISLAFSPLAAAIVCGVAFLLYIAWATANAVILKGELEQAAAIVESNKKTIEEQRTSIGEQAENINALGEQNKELNQSVENLEKINADLESAQEDLKNINAQLSALSEKQKESNVALEKSNENMQNSIDNLKKEAESKEQDIKNLQEKADMLKDKCQQQQAIILSVFDSHKSSLEQLQNTVRSQNEIIASILGNIESIGKGEVKLTEALKKAQERVAAIHGLLSQIVNLSCGNKEEILKKPVAEMGETIAKINELSHKANEELNALTETLTKDIIDAQKEISIARAQSEAQTKKLEETIKSQNEELGKLQKNIDENKKEIENLNKEYEEKLRLINEKMSSEVATKDSAIDKLKGELETSKSLIEQKKKEHEALIEKNKELEEVSNKTKNACDSAKRECENLKKRVEDQKETIKKLETSNQKVKEDNAKLETKNEELREVNESAQKHANSAGGGCGLGLVSFGIGFGVGVFGKALVNTFIGGKQ